MGNNSSDQFALGCVEASLEDYSDAASVQRRTRNACYLGIGGKLHSFIKFVLVVVIVDLEDFCPAKQHVGFVLSLMKLFVEI